MIFWLVMHMNEAMFSPIETTTKNFLQFMSYIELFLEFVAIVIGIIMLIDHLVEKHEGGVK